MTQLRSRAGVGLLLLQLLLLPAPRAAGAQGGRFGLFVGSNAAPDGREPLRHAQADAQRLRQVFVQLGAMEAADARLLLGPSPAEVLAALAALEERASERPGSVVVFFYSGHSDDRALLLGGSELPLTELRAALRRIPARLAVQLLDSCRSGALTRLKGARLGERFSLSVVPRAEGRVVITSSAAWEDSQESDRLGGSFFTLHLASGLRGAADRDRDGRVTVAEAYSYVYDRTVESTLATAAGPQHPAFRYDLQGSGETVLTWLGDGATLVFGRPRGEYVVFNLATGSIVAELPARGAGTSLALRAGRYRVLHRGADALSDGEVALAPGERRSADEHLTRRLRHARLVRKGGTPARRAHAIWLEGGARGPLGAGLHAAPLVRVAYGLTLPWLTLRPRVAFTPPGEPLSTPRLRMELTELSAGVELLRELDLPYLSLGGGLAVDGLWLRQREEQGLEPARSGFGLSVGLVGLLYGRPIDGLVVSLGVELAGYGFKATDARQEPTGGGQLRSVPTFRATAGLGWEL